MVGQTSSIEYPVFLLKFYEVKNMSEFFTYEVVCRSSSNFKKRLVIFVECC